MVLDNLCPLNRWEDFFFLFNEEDQQEKGKNSDTVMVYFGYIQGNKLKWKEIFYIRLTANIELHYSRTNFLADFSIKELWFTIHGDWS